MNLIRPLLFFSWLTAALAGWSFASRASDVSEPALASIRLYNPTSWDRPLPVEIPVGRLAAPGLIDWSQVSLVAEDGRQVPFAIREGRPHYKAQLRSPGANPRAEDLLVFACAVKPGTWVRIDVRPGEKPSQPATATARAEPSGQIAVSYSDFRAVIDGSSGMLTGLEAFGQSLLDAPLAIAISKIQDDKGTKQPLGPSRVRLVCQSSNAAMTELHFVLAADDRLSLAVSYRIHACGVIEILCDERPWQGHSPWIDHAAAATLRLGGKSEELPLLVNRPPFYGFKDFAEVVKHPAAIHRYPKATVLELGEETTNGRRFHRRLYVVPPQSASATSPLVDAADKGLVVDVVPKSLPLAASNSSTQECRIAYPAGNLIAAKILADAMKQKGQAMACVESGPGTAGSTITMALLSPQECPGIDGDGFEIRPASDGAVGLVACTRFGLLQGAIEMARHLGVDQKGVSVPLVASNPVVALRAGGFGGGDFEVDFPYGSEDEWHQAFDLMIASGMNVMADLGMWGNWKMPISYRHMPELRSDAPDAYDEVSGARFAEFDSHRQRGQRLLDYLHQRGAKVWLWLPVGCVPTTYAQKHPEAMAPKNDHCPCFTHPLYARYLEAFLKELLETYAIDGIVMIRDDNGGLCPCERCKAYVAASATRNAAWEQYLILYRWLKSAGFRGQIAVYPYFDLYQPRLDPLLPADLQIVGHGSAAAVLARSYDSFAPMGDTWLDNLFAGFRVPSTARMRRLLADCNGFWIGGAIRGCELPWASVGRFGWEPTATANTLRYEQGAALFGPARALDYVGLIDAYEQLWELYDLPMLPQQWMKLEDARRQEVVVRGQASLKEFRVRLATLGKGAPAERAPWLRHVELFGTYFEYHLRRLQHFARMEAIALGNKAALASPAGLPARLREELLGIEREIYDQAERLDQQAAAVPGNMLARTRANQMTRPFKEWVYGYDASLEYALPVRQFAANVEVTPLELKAGEPFVLRVRLQNTGACAWMPGVGHRLELAGEAGRLGLPAQWQYEGPWMVFADRREVQLRGVAPKGAGEAQLQVSFWGPFRQRHVIQAETVKLRWK